MEKKGQLTTETVAGMLNNTLMWERHSRLSSCRHTCISVKTNTSTCVHTNNPSIDNSTSQVLLQVAKPALHVWVASEYHWAVV